jgi:membrane protease YdiL (CAAX protease family)
MGQQVPQPVRTVGLALGLVVVIVAVEYVARHFVAPSLPILGSPAVNDMLTTAVFYGFLVTAVVGRWRSIPVAFADAVVAIVSRARGWLPWVGALVFLAAGIGLVLLDAPLWGSLELPNFRAPLSTTLLVPELARPLTIASFLLVNGLIIPAAEERLWRGAVQPSLQLAWGIVPALLVTAVLFSIKHAIIDASLGRLVAITAGGLVLGTVAVRAGNNGGGGVGWQTSTVSHMVANTIATLIFLSVTAA